MAEQRKSKPDHSNLFRAENVEGDRPNWNGDVEVSRALLKELVDKAKAGEPAVIEIGGWDKTGPKAGHFISIKIQKPYGRKNYVEDDDSPF